MPLGEHTPGPWRVFKPRGKSSRGIGPSKELIVARAAPCFYEGTHHAMANAALISAAPELLVALKETAEEMRNVEYSTRHYLTIDGPLLPEEWKRRDPKSYETWERAVDAIAKAEGRS